MFLSIFVMILSIKENDGAAGNSSYENWTTCEEFLEGSTLDPALVLDIDWKIFYFWLHEYEMSYQIRFSTPTEQLLQRYKIELDGKLIPPVQWSEAEFFMESSIDISVLYIRQNTSGLYRIIPNSAFKNDKAPLFMVAMKVIEPGYLGLMNCKQQICYLLAPIVNMPKKDQIEEIALKFNFVGEFNYSYVLPTETVTEPAPDVSQEEKMQYDFEKFEIL